jgi:hypothetical protein
MGTLIKWTTIRQQGTPVRDTAARLMSIALSWKKTTIPGNAVRHKDLCKWTGSGMISYRTSMFGGAFRRLEAYGEMALLMLRAWRNEAYVQANRFALGDGERQCK